ncbi:MAG TPA: heparan-alpha-glucosaminide N-acetyltransferase domain-containing protein [Hyphomicrobiaceae bacterium]|nr:heparan-alpha-glucosaminide N-acetyltransferase domain-containing protein [Hyphomicrobiaceae bacterium]
MWSRSVALSTLSPASPRLSSVDVFRGATIVAMILVNGQFSHEESYRQLAHAAWNGWTFADTIFPCFLFIVGVSLTLSTASRVARGEDHTRLLVHAVRRSLLIFGCGVVIDYLRVPIRDFPFVGFQAHLQLTGALQRIAVCYLVAFHIYLWGGLRGVIGGIIGLNLLYLGLLYFYPVPGCGPGSLAASCNFVGYLDEIVLDGFRSNSMAFDPDGVGSVLPAITSVLFGVLAGKLLLSEQCPRQRLLPLLGGAIVLVAAGGLLSMWVPINKQLWTTSFAVLMAGLALTGLACSIWLIDGRPLPSWFRPLETFGSNAIAAYLISRLVGNVPKVHVMGKSLYTDVLARVASPPNASLLFAMVVLAAVYLAVWLMDRRGWYLKL